MKLQKINPDPIFINDDGTRVPFAINREYDVVKDTATKAWGDVMQDK